MKNNLLILLLASFQLLFSQTEIQDNPYIKTVIFKPAAANLYAPIIQLGASFSLSFDDLNADEAEYYYKIEHCDIDWKPSGLIPSEYINGFAEDRIRNFNNSFNTLMPYTFYTVSFPNEYTKIKISGNYTISIINEDSEIVLVRRFVVYEPKVTVGVTVHKSRNIAQINTHQNLQFSINVGDFRINNPSQEILPVLIQNNNWQTAIKGLKPQFIRGNQLLYKYNNETSFYGGNEFLYFDSKDVRNATLNIARSELGPDIYNTYLYTNQERIDKPYTLFQDINGNFIVRNLNSEYSNIDADYTWVYFQLECLEDLSNKNVYVHGNFNNWALNDVNKMTYNTNSGLYELTMLMKQGFYNYQYTTLDEKGNMSSHDIDGSYYQTENDYTVIVYFKKFGSRYTQVIGTGYGNSKTLLN